MKTTTYLSQKIGRIKITVQSNHVTINTERLELRSLNQDSQDALIKNYNSLLSNPANVAFFCEGKPWEERRVEKLITTNITNWQNGEQFCTFSVNDAQSHQFIGSLDLHLALSDFATTGNGHENAVEIGYIFEKAFWGQGFGTHTALVAKKYVKHVLAEQETPLDNPPKEIVATVHPDNLGSLKILQKTLKNREANILTKFGGNPRFLFFKPLKPLTSEAIERITLEY